ncbi:MAG TPA: hypothetical protein DCW46_10160 [Desulfotomaculum sp.]|nr:hypothetical protein [Desulfotomaculum sp.]
MLREFCKGPSFKKIWGPFYSWYIQKCFETLKHFNAYLFNELWFSLGDTRFYYSNSKKCFMSRNPVRCRRNILI